MSTSTEQVAKEDVVWLTAEQQAQWRSFRQGVARLVAVLEHELAATCSFTRRSWACCSPRQPACC